MLTSSKTRVPAPTKQDYGCWNVSSNILQGRTKDLSSPTGAQVNASTFSHTKGSRQLYTRAGGLGVAPA